MYRESEIIELKQQVTEEIKKEVIAFANSSGGKLYVGITDDGSVVGTENADEAILQISNMIRDAIKPDVTMFVHYQIVEVQDKQVVEVDIQRGSHRPYYLGKKGLRPEGVFVRQGSSSAPASEAAIRQMIKETDGDSFEEMRSMEQELEFWETAGEFKRRGIDFEPKQMRTLKIIGNDGLYTNLGLLLSDQCPYTLKIGVFEGNDQNYFKDRQEFSGSLLKQMNEAYAFIDRYNATAARFEGLLRIDRRSYPEMAVREALLNALIHREYSFRASTLISIYSDRIEVVSIGGLISGITQNDILLGVSICRNPGLAGIFYRLQLIEAYGTGMQKIVNAYQGSAKQPQIAISDNAFKIILPNRNDPENMVDSSKDEWNKEFVPAVKEQVVAYTVDKNAGGIRSARTDRRNEEAAVLEYMKQNRLSEITRAEVEALLGISGPTAFRLLKKMIDRGILIQVPAGKNSYYYLK